MALENTEDYTDYSIGFYTYHYQDGRECVRYRLVTIGEDGRLEPYLAKEKFFVNEGTAWEYVNTHAEEFKVVPYDDLVHEAARRMHNGTSFAVTGPSLYLPIAQALVVEMGGEPVFIAEADRAIYHTALAHAANHLVTILGQSQQMLASIGIESPSGYMEPLVKAALDNALRQGENALTGPVARADVNTLAAHLKALNEYAEHENAADIVESYRTLAESTAKRAHNRSLLSDEQLGRILKQLGS